MTKLAVVGNESNEDAIKLCEELLERLRSGESVAAAFVEVRRGGEVASSYSKSEVYHCLNSGAARLAHRLASAPEDT